MKTYLSNFLTALIGAAALTVTAAPPASPAASSPAPVAAPSTPAATASTYVTAPATAATPATTTAVIVGQPVLDYTYTPPGNNFMPPPGGILVPGSVGGQLYPGTMFGGQLSPSSSILGGAMSPFAFSPGSPTSPYFGLGGFTNQATLPNYATTPNAVIIAGRSPTTTPGGALSPSGVGGSRVIVTGGATATAAPGGTFSANSGGTPTGGVIVTGGSSVPGSQAPGGTIIVGGTTNQ